MIPTIALLHTVALAEQPTERNLAATNLGVQYWNAPALKAAALAPGDIDGDGIPNDQDPDSKNFSDLDLIFGQRIRWTLSDNGSTSVRLRVNGQFTYSPGELGGSPAWKRNRVRQLGVSIVNDKVNVDIGRSQIHKGGPRLVDGLQVVAHVNNTTDVGAWAGLQPDLFTTDPRMRPGAGPILAYAASRVQASAVGEVVFAGGGLIPLSSRHHQGQELAREA
ncbi:MAG: hypothetical protein KC656_06340, partial [Myxococcales bacterium]|nr:hypothetical protein [Myxococcales bacterium]